jgi:integrase
MTDPGTKQTPSLWRPLRSPTFRNSPGKKGNRIKPYIDPAKFSALLALIPEPYATMVYVAVYTGLRASELIGLKWKNVRADSITIEERYCRGEWGKSEASNATIPVNLGVIERIHWLKTVTVEVKAGTAVRRYSAVKATGPDDIVFASVAKGVPMRDNNVLLANQQHESLEWVGSTGRC